MEYRLFDYPRDTIWKNYLIPESIIHGARYNMHLYLDLVEEFTNEGDTILDPFGGIGSCLAAMTLGRHVAMIELESRFVTVAFINENKIRQDYNVPTSIRSLILEGDNRHILPLHTYGVNAIILSPPYGASVHPVDKWELKMKEIYGSTTQAGYGEHPNNIGNLPHEMQRFELEDVYTKCFKTLSKGGKMITITKDSVKNGKQQYQCWATIQACVKAGFELVQHCKRQCQVTARQRTHMKHAHEYAKGYTPVTMEDVLIFKK